MMLNCVKIPGVILRQDLNVNDDDYVWIYINTYDDDLPGDFVRYKYDELKFIDGKLNIKTHFQVIKRQKSSAASSGIMVLTIVPVEQ